MLKDSLLWEITAPDSSVVSYLFGSMHVRDERAFQLVDKVIVALCKCTHLMCEIDLDHAQTSLDPKVYMLDNMTISQLITPKRYEKYKSIISKSYGFNLDQLDSFYPIIVFNKISEVLLSNDRAVTLDMYLWNKAKALNLTLGGIEKLEEHIAILEQLELSEQLRMLKLALGNTAKFGKSIKRLSQLYKNQKIQELYKLTKSSMGSLRHILLYNRNRIMSERICDHSDIACTYVVGAAHLAGNSGVLNHLKKKHYKIKAVI